MPRRPETKSELTKEMEGLKARIAEAERRESARVGLLALKAGLTDLELDGEVLLSEVKAMAARFQKAADQKDARPAGRKRRGGETEKSESTGETTEPSGASVDEQKAA